MDATVDAGLRWARSAVLALVASLVAVGAHVTADGRLPSGAVLLLVWVALVVAARPLLRRPASARRVVLLTVGGQTLAHGVLSAAGGHGPAGHAATASAEHARPVHGHPESAFAPAVHDLCTHLVGDLTTAGAPMLLTHLLAAALVGLWLAAGERTVWTLLSLAWRVLVLLVRRSAPAVPIARPAAARAVVSFLRRATAGTVVRRGPPHLLAA